MLNAWNTFAEGALVKIVNIRQVNPVSLHASPIESPTNITLELDNAFSEFIAEWDSLEASETIQSNTLSSNFEYCDTLSDSVMQPYDPFMMQCFEEAQIKNSGCIDVFDPFGTSSRPEDILK